MKKNIYITLSLSLLMIQSLTPMSVLADNNSYNTKNSVKDIQRQINDNQQNLEQLQDQFTSLQDSIDKQEIKYDNINKKIKDIKNKQSKLEKENSDTYNQYKKIVRLAQEQDNSWMTSFFSWLSGDNSISKSEKQSLKEKKSLIIKLHEQEEQLSNEKMNLISQEKNAKHVLSKMNETKKTLKKNIDSITNTLKKNQQMLSEQQKRDIAKKAQESQNNIKKLQDENKKLQKEANDLAKNNKNNAKTNNAKTNNTKISNADNGSNNESKKTGQINNNNTNNSGSSQLAPESPSSPIVNSDVGYVFNHDLRIPSGLSSDQLAKGLKGGLVPLAPAFIQAEKKYKVNAIFLASVAAVESGWGNTDTFGTNNIFGYRGKSFNSKADSIDYVAAQLKQDYLTQGGQFFNGYNVAGVSKMYNLGSQTWVDTITGIGESIGVNAYN